MQLLNPRLHPTQFLVCLYLSKCSITEAGGIAIAGSLAADKLQGPPAAKYCQGEQPQLMECLATQAGRIHTTGTLLKAIYTP